MSAVTRALVFLVVVGLLIGTVVLIARRSKTDAGGGFWPQSPIGQIGAVVLAVFVIGAIVSFAV